MWRCLEQVVKWWRILDASTHELIAESECAEVTGPVYAEYSDGRKEAFDVILPDPSLWKAERLPDGEIENVRQLLNQGDIVGLILIHNKYKLSNLSFCCDSMGLTENFEHIIKMRSDG